MSSTNTSNAAGKEEETVVAHEEHHEEEDYEESPMSKVWGMLYERKEVDGESRLCCIEYLTLDLAKAIVAEFEKDGATYDFEAAHSNEDATKDAFLRGLALGKYTLEETREIATLLGQIGGFPHYCA